MDIKFADAKKHKQVTDWLSDYKQTVLSFGNCTEHP